jgi:hypothetical protein
VEKVVLNERLMTCADAKQELLAMGLTDVQADAVVAQAVQAMTARLGLIFGVVRRAPRARGALSTPTPRRPTRSA